MRVLALISGGKDSIYNIMKCIAAGHDVVALGNIHPAGLEDELDSFMYQTVGHEGVNFIADAIGLPLFRQPTAGKAYCEDLIYTARPDDEVEDLHQLVKDAQTKVKFEGVAVGAIASDYQRLRVENVCGRLGLTSLAYLWQENQAKLLTEMIYSNIDAILVKVASLGLEPQKHLGVSIKDIQSRMEELNRKYGSNICGEGGEYETFVLNCPLFHRKIVLDDVKMMSDAISGHLRINKAHLEDNFPSYKTHADTWSERQQLICKLVPDSSSHVEDCLVDISLLNDEVCDIVHEALPAESRNTADNSETDSNWLYIGNLLSPTIDDALLVVRDKLEKHGMSLNNVMYTNLWLRDMTEFASVNRAYVEGMKGVAPARACVAVPLPAENPVLLEVLAHRSKPADNIIVLAGQIPMIPGSMSLLNSTLAHQIRLAARHCARVLAVSKASLRGVILASVYVASEENVGPAVQMTKTLLKDAKAEVVGVVVSTLPRKADVEIQMVATINNRERHRANSSYTLPTIQLDVSILCTEGTSVLTGRVTPLSARENVCSEDLRFVLYHCINTIQSKHRVTTIRLLYRSNAPELRDKLASALNEVNAQQCVSLVPVCRCELDQEILAVVGFSL